MEATTMPGARVVPAVSVDHLLAARLSAAVGSGTVHSVHPRVVNLRVPDGSLCCVSSTTVDDAPRTVRIAVATWQDLGWRRGDPVIFEPGSIQSVDGTRVELDGARRWRPPVVDLSRVAPDQLRSVASVIGRRLLPPPSASAFEVATAPVLERSAAALRAALCHEDQASVTAIARSLVGLGTGLTPSGDDLLVGLATLAALRGMRIGALRPALQEAIEVGPPLETRTTAVSAAALAEAAVGRTRDRVHRLFEAIGSTGLPEGAVPAAALVAAVDDVRAIGHTSGADVLAGIRLGLLAEAHLREAALPPRSPSQLQKEIS